MAYVTATLVKIEAPFTHKDATFSDGSVSLLIEFTGNAGEPPRTQRYTIRPTDTLKTIRHWAINVAANLGSTKSIADALTVGQSVDLTPIVPTPPTAKETWILKFEKYRRYAIANWAGALSTDLSALKADIEATYQASYL